MAAQHIGQYVSKVMALFDEAGARLMASQQIARERFELIGLCHVAPLIAELTDGFSQRHSRLVLGARQGNGDVQTRDAQSRPT